MLAIALADTGSLGAGGSLGVGDGAEVCVGAAVGWDECLADGNELGAFDDTADGPEEGDSVGDRDR